MSELTWTLKKFCNQTVSFYREKCEALSGGDDLPKTTHLGDKTRVEYRIEEPLCRTERTCLEEKKSWDRCHEWKTCYKASWGQKNKESYDQQTTEERGKEKNWILPSNSQILGAKLDSVLENWASGATKRSQVPLFCSLVGYCTISHLIFTGIQKK